MIRRFVFVVLAVTSIASAGSAQLVGQLAMNRASSANSDPGPTANSAQSPTPAEIESWAVPDCAVRQDGLPGSANQAQSAPGAAPAGDRTESIVKRTGAVTAEMLHRIPNLIAREDVRQTIAPSSQRLVSTEGRRPQFAGLSLSGPEYHDRAYNYRIVPKGSSGLDGGLDEFRTDNHDHPIADPVKDPDSPRSTGFATSWLFFVPGNIPESRFRYLGEQKVGNRDTYVVAFAQTPGHTHIDTIVHTPTGGCATYSQGLAWIDQSTYRIVRMQTDLLYPIASIELDQLRSVLDYGEVKIKALNLTLWLPSDVETSWVSGDRAGDEVHTYSNYRLFASTMTILPPDQTPTQ
jgi:hypothetical protein